MSVHTQPTLLDAVANVARLHETLDHGTNVVAATDYVGAYAKLSQLPQGENAGYLVRAHQELSGKMQWLMMHPLDQNLFLQRQAHYLARCDRYLPPCDGNSGNGILAAR